MAKLLHSPTAKILISVRAKANVEELRVQFRRYANSLPPEFPGEAALRETGHTFVSSGEGQVHIVEFGAEVAENDFDLCVIDDPQSYTDAKNLSLQQRAADCMADQVMAKLAPDGAAVLVQSRLHEHDLSGKLTTTTSIFGPTGWYKYTHRAAWQDGVFVPNGNRPPAVLCPEHRSAMQMLQVMADLPPDEIAARYQQSPMASDANVPAVLMSVCLRYIREGEVKFAQEAQGRFGERSKTTALRHTWPSHTVGASGASPEQATRGASAKEPPGAGAAYSAPGSRAAQPGGI